MKLIAPKSIQCEYKGYMMRSLLEKRIAQKLDEMKVRWYYEPQGFVMDDGTCYLPDFYLPDQKIWIEGKGIISDADIHKCNCFVKENENNEPLLIVFPDGKTEIMGAYLSWGYEGKTEVRYRLYNEDGIYGCKDDFIIAKCTECGRFYVQDIGDTYTCLMCKSYDGDHFVRPILSNGDNFFDLENDLFN